MLCSLYRLNEEQAEKLRQSPESVGELMGWTPIPEKPSFLKRLFGHDTVKSISEQQFAPLPKDCKFDLNQARHVLHFLFTGSNEGGDFPASFIMSGGQEIGSDSGYGPTRFLSPALTKELAEFLASVTLSEMDNAYDPVQMEAAEIYW